MLLNKEVFNSKSNIKKFLIVLKTLTPEKSSYFYLSLVFMLILGFFAVSIFLKNNHTKESPQYNQVLNVYSDEKVKNFTPLFAESKTEKIISGLLFAGLIKNQGDSYILDLAESVYISDSGLEVKIKLKDSLKFSNGEKITTDDVIYTYKLMQSFDIDNKDRVKYEGLSFEKVDDINMNITLKKSYSQVNKLLTLGIISKDQYIGEKIGDFVISDKNLNPISSGQYAVNSVSNLNGVIGNMSLKNNNKYYNLSNFGNINFYTEKLESDKSIIDSYMKDNSIDIALGGAYSEYLDTTIYNTKSYNTTVVNNIFLNPSKNDILSKKINREYLYKNINRDYIVKNILMNNADTSFDIMPNSKNINPLTEVDIEKTSLKFTDKTSVVSSGTSTDPQTSAQPNANLVTSIKLTFLNTDTNQKIYNYLQQTFIKNSINIISVPVNQDTLQSIIKNRDFEMLMTNISIEDVSSLYSFLHSSQKNAPGLNITNYISKTFDKNIEVLRSATNTIDINNSLSSLRQEFYEEYPYIPLYSKINKVNITKELKTNTENNISNGNEENILKNISADYKETEYLYTFLEKYRNIIIKVNKIIH